MNRLNASREIARRMAQLREDNPRSRVRLLDAEDAESALDWALPLIVEHGHRLSIWTPDRTLLARWGDVGTEPGQFATFPHSLCVDSRGDLYVAEVGTMPDRVQKWEKV